MSGDLERVALTLSGIDAPKTHDLDDLRRRLLSDRRVKDQPADLSSLSDFAVDSRYPDDISPVTPLQSATAVRQAIVVVRLVRDGFERRSVPTDGLAPR
jgi:HEPN domain-containing protein